ncbi:hypothetical protein M9458_050483 [Cirrhinus mrigala]|uniref:Tyr recombinase domain-containing protein n=1 Tax=Cirrhinus mrigala TaxID=683832 RepID=A0ABD0MW44_CIRMR
MSKKVTDKSKPRYKFLPCRILALGAAGREQPQPTTRSYTGHLRNRASPLRLLRIGTEISGARGPTCRLCFRRRSPRKSGPDSFAGPLRAAPTGEKRDTELAVQKNPEGGLERLVPLVDYFAAWKLLPNVSACVLSTVEQGYRIQFGAPPPPFSGVFPALVGPEQGLVMEQEVDTLLRKEAIEVVPPQDRESGFLSQYFIVPKKDGGPGAAGSHGSCVQRDTFWPAVYETPTVVAQWRPPVRPWDLSVVLEALCIEDLTIKTVLLLALMSLKRVGDLQALSVAPSHLDFAPGMAKAFLYPRSEYVPKVPSSAPRAVVLQAFCPPPFLDSDQQKLNCMCPVRALDTYFHRAAVWRRADQLFVCYGPLKRGLPASKQTLSRWIVDAISFAYDSSGLPSPLGVKAHSTRGIAASKAFMSGVPMQDICSAAGWSTPLTFVRFYNFDLRVSPGSSVLSS